MQDTKTEQPPALWAIVELFGHQRVAGRVSQQTFGGGAIYAINWCDETTAQIAARAIKHEPLSPYSVKSAIDALPDDQRHRLLTGSRRSEDDFFDDN